MYYVVSMFIFTLFHCDTFISCEAMYNFCKLNSPGNSPGKPHHGLEPENDDFELGDNESYTALGGVSSCCTDSWPSKRPEVRRCPSGRQQCHPTPRGGVPDVCEDVFLPDRDGKILRP